MEFVGIIHETNNWLTGIRKKDILPNKLSELLFLALKDMQIIKKNKDYELNMGYWHNNDNYKVSNKFKGCLVCMAGAVMANTLKAPKDKGLRPLSYKNKRIVVKLNAIDSLRCLDIYEALRYLIGDQYNNKINKLAIKHNIPALDKKISKMLNIYRGHTDPWNFKEIVNNSHKHIGFYKKYAKLLEKAGL